MQIDFHYYAAYCAAYIAGFSHEESLAVCYSDQFVDMCTRNFLSRIKGPMSAATTQGQIELVDARTDLVGLQDITRIWSSFHFLPGDLYAPKKAPKLYRSKFRLICNPNGSLLADTVENAKGRSLQAAGIAMHVLSDTWAHRYFAGTPSLVINNTNTLFYDIFREPGGEREQKISFRHSTSTPDDLENSLYTNSIYQPTENSIMNLGHGRAGHLPDYCFARYRYLPAWADYEEVYKDNPHDYFCAFTQMVYALRYLRGDIDSFKVDTYDLESVAPCEAEIKALLEKRQLRASDDWKALGERLSGKEIPDFDENAYVEEYLSAPDSEKDGTFLGRFFIGALSQKSLVTNKIFKSGNLLAGFSVDFDRKGFGGIKDFRKLVEDIREAAEK